MKLTNLALIVATLIVASSAMAQGGGGGQRRGRGGGNQNSLMGLVNRADVQKELGITDDEKSKITDLRTATTAKMTDLRGSGGDRAAMTEGMTKINADADASLSIILTSDQNKRLKELLIQRLANSAVFNKDVQAALGLTDDQKSKLKDLQEKEQTANRELQQKQQNQEIDRQAATEARTKNAAVMKDEIDKVLTDDQKSKLKDMGGKPFTFEATPPRGGGGRRGGN